jgi:CheY-like chemotaxis protein
VTNNPETHPSIKRENMSEEQREISGPILVIEDNWHDLVLMTHVLDDLDLKGQVMAVHNGTAALERILEVENGRIAKPTAIVVDLGLPDIPGEQVIAEIRRQKSLENTPVVIFSDAPLERCEALVNKYVLQGCRQKPADFAEFQRVFAELLLRWINGGEKSKSAEGVA